MVEPSDCRTEPPVDGLRVQTYQLRPVLRLEIPGQATDVLLVAKVLGFVVLPRKTDILC